MRNDPAFFIEDGDVEEVGILPVEYLEYVIVQKPPFLHQAEPFIDQVVYYRDGRCLAEQPPFPFGFGVENAFLTLDGKITGDTHKKYNRYRRNQYELVLKAQPGKKMDHSFILG